MHTFKANGKLTGMLKLVPNILTLGRLILTVIFLIMILRLPFAADKIPFLDITFAVFLIAGLTDIFDGPIARKLNVTSKFGRMMDPLADKFFVCGAFICFAIVGEPKVFGLGPAVMNLIRWSVAGIIILREIYVTALRHTAEAKGINFAATFSGKIKMFLQSVAIGAVILKAARLNYSGWPDWVTAASFIAMLTVTVASGVRATQRKSWRQTIS